MIQKVLKVGSSAAVTIPKKSLTELGIKIGDNVTLSIDKAGKRVTIEASTIVDKELLQWTKKFVEQYRPALVALSKK
ncbi:MAG: AbrB/MazE/SpoVT family DNA-binding domain-containing protein [Patescibacteria group bacterium]